MALKWDDGESLNDFISNNSKLTSNIETDKISSNQGTVTICEMTRRIIDTLVLNGIDEQNPELFNELIQRLTYVYISAKKMQNRIVKLGGNSTDLFESVDENYDIQNRISRVQKLKNCK